MKLQGVCHFPEFSYKFVKYYKIRVYRRLIPSEWGLLERVSGEREIFAGFMRKFLPGGLEAKARALKGGKGGFREVMRILLLVGESAWFGGSGGHFAV